MKSTSIKPAFVDGYCINDGKNDLRQIYGIEQRNREIRVMPQTLHFIDQLVMTEVVLTRIDLYSTLKCLKWAERCLMHPQK